MKLGKRQKRRKDLLIPKAIFCIGLYWEVFINIEKHFFSQLMHLLFMNRKSENNLKISH